MTGVPVDGVGVEDQDSEIVVALEDSLIQPTGKFGSKFEMVMKAIVIIICEKSKNGLVKTSQCYHYLENYFLIVELSD